MHKILSEIIESKRKSLAKSKTVLSEADIIKEAKSLEREVRSFKEAIKGKERLSLISEIKHASPSKGIIRKDFNPEKIAQTYKLKGASAISVLTEENFFKGSLADLREVKEAVDLPVLRKDFIFDIYQIYESYLAGADCVLLIAKIVSQGELSRLFHSAKALGMDALVEVHSEAELESALRVNADIVGINNRDLEDFSLDIDISRRLAALVPKEKIVVSESGITSHEDIELLRSFGIDAVLIGAAFLKESDIIKAIDNIWY